MMLKSDNVSLANLAPQLALACVMANEVYHDYDVDMVITSANDSNHSTTSLHYAGAAVDLRTYTLDESKRSERGRTRRSPFCLPARYDLQR